MKIFYSKSFALFCLFVIFQQSVHASLKLSCTVRKNGKEINLPILPVVTKFEKNYLNSKKIVERAISLARKINKSETVYYLLDSLTNKDISLSPDADIEAAFEYKYDNEGRISLMLSKEYDYSSNRILVKYKSMYQYGENYVKELNYDYSGTEVSFEVYKTIIDDSGKVLQIKLGTDSLDLEKFDIIEDYQYENNLLKSYTTTFIESNTQSTKTDYYYGTNSKLDSTILSVNNGLGTMLKNTKTSYTYNGSGNLISEIVSSWDNEWLSNSTSTYEYDANNNCTKMLYTEPMSDEFIVSSEYSFEYNTNILNSNVFSGKTFNEFSFNFQNQITRSTIKILMNNEMLSQYQIDFHYSVKSPTAINNQTETSKPVIIYDFGSKSFLLSDTLVSSQKIDLCIYDITGKKVLLTTDNSAHTFKVNSLKSGLYFYRFTSGTKLYSGKIYVE